MNLSKMNAIQRKNFAIEIINTVLYYLQENLFSKTSKGQKISEAIFLRFYSYKKIVITYALTSKTDQIKKSRRIIILDEPNKNLIL